MKQFELYGKTIQISKSREEYNRYRRRFLQMAMQSRLAFQNAYQKNQSLDDVVKNGPEQMQACVQPAIDYCLQQLVDKGVLTYDAERLEEEFQISDVWGSAYLKVYDQFAEIAMNEEELNQYRTARRQNRGRWVGGGFGVEGAIRGATTAGAMNIVTGAGHMIFNGIGSIMTSVSSDHKRKKIFQNPETYQVLENGVSGAVFMLHYVLIECLQQNGVTSLPCDGIVSDQESREATAILRNISKINKDNAAVNALLDALNKDPYNLEWYRTALQYFGDADHTLESIADHFCILNLRQEKADQLEAFAESFSLETEENANKALKEVKQEKKRLGYAQDTPTVEKIRQAVTDFDTAFRTVDGILHNSRKEAELSRSELDQLQVIEQNLDTENLQSLDQAEQAMGKLSSVVAKQHKEALQTEKNNLIVRLRTVDLQIPSSSGYLCQTIEDAQALAPLVEEIVQALSACNDSEDPTASLTALQEEISGKPVPDGIKDCYQAEIVARLHAIEAAPRTALGKEYDTEDARKEAEATYQSLEKAVNSVSNINGAKKVWKKAQTGDFSEEASDALLKKLHERVKAKRSASATKYKLILAVIVIVSMFFSLSVTESYVNRHYNIFGYGLQLAKCEVQEGLGLMDGLKNGVLVCGRNIGDNILSGIGEYTRGFHYSLIGNIIWLVLGWFIVAFKYVLLFFARYAVTFLSLLVQKASILYYAGYLLTAGLSFTVLIRSVKDDEDDDMGKFRKELEEESNK